jgi:hypothetical protein
MRRSRLGGSDRTERGELDVGGAALSMSPAMAAHIEFAALCAIAAAEPRPRPSAAATNVASSPAHWAGRSPAERKRA